MDRAAVDAEDLLKLVLVLVVVWLVLQIVEQLLDIALGAFGVFRPIISLVILALIVLFLLDRI